MEITNACTFNKNKSEILYNGKRYHLSRMEGCLLEIFFKRKGELIHKDEIIDLLWPESRSSQEYTDNLIQLIHKVRRVLVICGMENSLVTVRNKGYRFELPPHPIPEDYVNNVPIAQSNERTGETSKFFTISNVVLCAIIIILFIMVWMEAH